MKRTDFPLDFLEQAQHCSLYEPTVRNNYGIPTLQQSIAEALALGVGGDTPAVEYATSYVEAITNFFIAPMIELEAEVGIASDISGVADVIIKEDNSLHVIKWLTGWGDYHLTARESLEAKALGAFLMSIHEVSSVTVHVVEVTKESATTVVLNRSDIVDMADTVHRAVAHSVAGRVVATGSQCRSCTNAVSCPAIRRELNELEMHRNVDLLTMDELEEAQEHQKVVGNWMKTVERQLTKAAECGDSPKWTIKPSRSTRKWNAQGHAAMIKELSAYMGKEIESHRNVPLSIADLEKQYGKRKDVADIMRTAIVHHEGKPKLARKEGI